MTRRRQAAPHREAVKLDWPGWRVHLYGIGDCHVGAANADERAQAKLARLIADDPDALVIGLGDMVEAIAVDDRRFDPAELAAPIDPEMLRSPFYTAAMRWCKIWEPTAGKWLLMIDGNHETAAMSHYHTPLTAWLAERMRCPYVGGTDQCAWAIIRLVTGDAKSRRARFRVFAIHGFGGGELSGSAALKLERLMMRKQADLVLMAHMHQSQVQVKTVEVVNDGGTVSTRQVYGAIVPPLVGQHGYIARKGGNAPAVGCLRADFSHGDDGSDRWQVTLCDL